MPEVMFYYNAARVSEDAVAQIAEALPGAIAGAFNRLGERPVLAAQNVGVRVIPIGLYDKNISPISIEIEARRTPARQHSFNLGEYLKTKLLEAIGEIPALQVFKGTGECSVSVVLADMAFGTI